MNIIVSLIFLCVVGSSYAMETNSIEPSREQKLRKKLVEVDIFLTVAHKEQFIRHQERLRKTQKQILFSTEELLSRRLNFLVSHFGNPEDSLEQQHIESIRRLLEGQNIQNNHVAYTAQAILTPQQCSRAMLCFASLINNVLTDPANEAVTRELFNDTALPMPAGILRSNLIPTMQATVDNLAGMQGRFRLEGVKNVLDHLQEARNRELNNEQ